MRRDPGPVPELGAVRRVSDRLAVLRWVILAVWAVLLGVRLALTTWVPDTNLTLLGVVQVCSIVVGVVAVVAGVWHSWTSRRRLHEEALARAVRRFDPTVRVVPAVVTEELRDAVLADHPDVALQDEVLWGFGATEASLWQADGTRAIRILAIEWPRLMHVALETDERRSAVVALHYVRDDGRSAVASFRPRRALGSSRTLGRGAHVDRLVGELGAELVRP